MLGFLVEHYPEHRLRPDAQDLLGRIERGEPTGLETGPGEAGEEPPIHGDRLAKAIRQKIGRVGSPGWRRLSLAVKAALLICALTYGVTWYLRDRHQSVDDIDPAVLRAPVQTPVEDTGLVKFTRDGYAYELTPRFDYTIAGLVVSLRDYTFMSVRSSDSVFPMDLCLMWGSNVSRRAHQSPDIEFDASMSPSLCHAYGVSANFFLISEVLGIRPAGVGYDQIYFNPNLAAMEWATASVPTPKGSIKVDWHFRETGELEVSLEATYPLEVVAQLDPNVASKTILKVGENGSVLK